MGRSFGSSSVSPERLLLHATNRQLLVHLHFDLFPWPTSNWNVPSTMSELQVRLIKHDGVKVLLRLGTNAAAPVKHHICALALQSLSKQEDGTVDPHAANIVQEGLVTVIAALVNSHQPKVLVAAVTLLQAVVFPPVAARSKNAARVALVSANNTAITPKRSPPDWTKVVINSMAAWPELESRATSPVTRTGSADVSLRSSSARGQIGDGNNSDERPPLHLRLLDRKTLGWRPPQH